MSFQHTNDLAKTKWQALSLAYPSYEALFHSTFQLLKKSYGNSAKHYHTLNHITQLLVLQEQFKNKIIDNESFAYAIFFHDFIYSVSSKDNEQKSAGAAADFLSAIGYDQAKILKVSGWINATKSHQNPGNDTDLDYLLDFDLSILGASREAYEVYTKQIRKEYSIYPLLLYNPGRKKVLQHFLAMDAIYKTTAFKASHEQPARANLLWEMEKL